MNALTNHGGSLPEGKDVTDAGVKLLTTGELHKYVCLTNPSDAGVYIALTNTGTSTCTAVVSKGIYIAPLVGFYEMNNVNMFYGDIWAITGSGETAHICIQVGK